MNRPAEPIPKPRLRVLHVVPSFYPAVGYGGPVRALFELCRAQVEAGLDVRVLTSDADGTQRMTALSNRWVTDFGVPTFYAPVRIGKDIAPSLVVRIAQALAATDLVHVSGLWSPTSLLGLSLAALHRRPIVLSPHGSLMPWALHSGRGRTQKMAALRLLRPLIDRIAGWHVSSQAEADGIRALCSDGLLSERTPITCVEYGIWPDAIATTDKPPLARNPQIVVLGRIHPVKRLELAIDALWELHKTHPTAQLILAGPTEDPGYRARLEQQAASRGLAQAVFWPGLLDETKKTELLSSAAVLWLCSHMESFGMVVIEALSQGTPVIATTQTPWPQLASERIGAQVDADPRAFAESTRALFSQPEALQKAQSNRCRDFVRSRYTWPALTARLCAFYETCAGVTLHP